MKKFGIIAVLAMLTIGVSAQTLNNDHPAPVGNTAILNQEGLNQWGFIFQFGDGNLATINQGNIVPLLRDDTDPTGSNGNTAFITQIGFNNIGTINQTGHGNLANLWQLNWGWYHGDQYADIVNRHHGSQRLGAEGTITQTGDHNIASVLQLSGSKLDILQGGNYNYIGGANSVSFCGGLERYSYQQSCNPNFMFQPLIVGENQVWEVGSINQTDEGQYFFGLGVLKGTRFITQSNYLAETDVNQRLAYNAIWLSQDGGAVTLSQDGRKNRIWLDVNLLNGDETGPVVNISQTGYKNYVAKFYGPCDNCATGPAKFNGKSLDVIQNGDHNRLSIDSDGWNNVIQATQTGSYNFGMIVQKGITYQHHFASYCGGCQ